MGMSLKENRRAFFLRQPFEHLPLGNEGQIGPIPHIGWYEHPYNDQTGLDWFGCAWEYVDVAGAPAPDLRKGPMLDDICDWEEVVKFPDLDAFDWENSIKLDKIENWDRENNLVRVVVHLGLWERLHVLMGFEEALCALIEEPEACAAFFDAMVDYKIKLIGKINEYYNIDFLTFHDDYGTQTGPFFDPETWRELIKPRLKKIVDYTHDLGIIFELHSCGKYDAIIPDLAEIGIDSLQCMDINDLTAALAITGDKMVYHPSVHEQLFNSLDDAGLLTEEMVRDMIGPEFREWGATGHFDPFIFPPRNWYEQIIWDEFSKVREELWGAFGVPAEK